jgi:hypothetical protein
MNTTTIKNAPRSWPDLFLFSGATLLLYLGWNGRQDTWLTAEEGLGYALGIIGGSMMLGLLLYPLRKKARWMARLGPVTAWFRTHMWLGVLGPVAILYHSNFQLGSLNSNVALFAMATVALSGLVGRYFYTKVHRSLYSSRLSLGELRAELGDSRAELGELFKRIPQVDEALKSLESQALRPSSGILSAWLRLLRVRIRGVRLRRSLRRRLAATIDQPQELRDAMAFIRAHIKTVQRIAGFALYDRLLSLWHLLHLPLFIMLVIAGLAHVVAVHMY